MQNCTSPVWVQNKSVCVLNKRKSEFKPALTCYLKIGMPFPLFFKYENQTWNLSTRRTVGNNSLRVKCLFHKTSRPRASSENTLSVHLKNYFTNGHSYCYIPNMLFAQNLSGCRIRAVLLCYYVYSWRVCLCVCTYLLNFSHCIVGSLVGMLLRFTPPLFCRGINTQHLRCFFFKYYCSPKTHTLSHTPFKSYVLDLWCVHRHTHNLCRCHQCMQSD